jgi:CBS domain-containing protein
MSIDRIMQRPVVTLPPEATCADAAALMRDENIGAIVIAESGRPLGVVTDRDLVTRVIADGMDAGKTQLRDVMSGEPIFLGGERSIEQVIAAMGSLAIRRVPVVDDAGQLCGLVSMDDMLILLADQLGDLARVIRQEIGND